MTSTPSKVDPQQPLDIHLANMMKKAFGLKKSKDTAPPASSSLDEPRRGQEFKSLDEFEILETLGTSSGQLKNQKNI